MDVNRTVFLRVAHILGLGGLDNSSSSKGATVHSLRASAPGPGDTSKEVLFSPGGATAASRGRALLSPRLGLGMGKGKGRLGTSWGIRPQAMNFRRYAAGENGMVQMLGDSGNSTDRPHASTVGIRSVVGPIAGSGTLEAVPAQPVEPVRVRLASQELSGEFSHSLQALAPLQRPVMEAECGPDQGS